MSKKRARGNGDADVWPRKNKEGKIIGYRGSYRVHTASGKKRRYVSGKTKSETRAALNKANADADRGLVFDAQDLRLGEYLDRWLTHTKGTVRQRTWERYEQIARVHLKPAFGHLKLKSLSLTHVRGLYREKLDSGLAPRTVQYLHTTLSRALKDAVTEGLVPRNVAKGVKAPRPAKKEINPLSPEQAQAFLEGARGPSRSPLRSGRTARFEAGWVVGAALRRRGLGGW